MLRRSLLAALAGLFQFLPAVQFDPRRTGNASNRSRHARDSNDTTAIVDRIENGTAVVLFEADDLQRSVPATVLPENAREEGTVLRVPDGDALALATVDHEATAERRESAQDRFDDLSERPDEPGDQGESTP